MDGFRNDKFLSFENRRGPSVGVWNGWRYGIAFLGALNFQILEPEIWQKSLFLRNFKDFPGISASEKYFSDSGKWPFHMPPIHTPTNRKRAQHGFGEHGLKHRTQ